MMNFEVGYSYPCILNGKHAEFKVIENHTEDLEECVIRWDDGEEEWASVEDMKRWCMALTE